MENPPPGADCHVVGTSTASAEGRLLSAAPEDARGLDQLLEHVTCSVVQAGRWLPVPAHWTHRHDGRPSYTFWLCVGGGAEYRLSEQTYVLPPGGVILAPPHVAREGRHDPARPLQLYTVHFHVRLYGVLDLPAVCRLPVTLLPATATFERMVRIANQIVDELAAGEPGYVLAANGLCAELVALYWREAAAHDPAAETGVHTPLVGALAALTRMAPVFRLIEARYAEPLTLLDLAAVAHLHPAYLSTLFHRVVGVPPLRYLARYRLDRACELLLSSDLPVRTIARRTGFRDPTYLNRVFRRAEGTTPIAYRAAKKSPTFG